MPKVTVIIPNFNHARFLERRIQSVLNQTYQDFEVIYIDDASTDESNKVFSTFATEKRVRAIYNETNSGIPFKQWNKGAAEARGEYLWISEADDYADSGLLAELVAVMDRHPQVGVAYCQSWKVDENDIILSSWQEWTERLHKERWRQDFVNNGKEEIRRYLMFTNTIPNASAVVIRRSVYEKVGGADETFKLNGDYMLWVKMLLTSDIGFVAKHLNYFRTHSNTTRNRVIKEGLNIGESYRIRCHIMEHLEVPEDTVEKVRDRLFGLWFNSERNRMSLRRHMRIYQSAVSFDPKIKRRLGKKIWRRLGSVL